MAIPLSTRLDSTLRYHDGKYGVAPGWPTLPEWPGGPLASGATFVPGYSYELAASNSGTFYTLQVGAGDYGSEFALRVTGAGTATVQASDPAFTFLQNSGTTGPSLVLTSTNIPNVEYRVLPTKVVRPMRGYVIGTGSTGGGSSGGGSTGPVGPWAMTVGAQGWFQVQADAASGGGDSSTWSGDHAMITSPAINWATAYGSPSAPGDLSAVNIWRPETLALWSTLNGPIRFMDWGAVNFNPSVNWSDRVLPTQSQYYFEGDPDTFGDAASSIHVKGMAYEWMIDLCNRTDRPMWVCVPHLYTDAAVTSLAQLIKARLKPSLSVYVEYSNETWNFGSGTLVVNDGPGYSGGNHRAQADHIIMAGVDGNYPGENAYYKGYAYHCVRSYQIWYLFQQTFGSDANRLKNVMSCNGNIDLLRQGLYNTYYSLTLNPNQVPMHLCCTAPYISGQNAADWQASVDACLAAGDDGNVYEIKGLALEYQSDWGCYEGGMQAAASGCDTWSANPDVYNAYLYLLNKMGAAGCRTFVHYTLVGKHYATKAWGLLDNTYEPDSTAHRWRATKDWLDANP